MAGPIAHLVAGRMEQVKGIDPSYAAWEAAVLSLNYACGLLFCSAMPRILVAKEIFHIQGAAHAFVSSDWMPLSISVRSTLSFSTCASSFRPICS